MPEIKMEDTSVFQGWRQFRTRSGEEYRVELSTGAVYQREGAAFVRLCTIDVRPHKSAPMDLLIAIESRDEDMSVAGD